MACRDHGDVLLNHFLPETGTLRTRPEHRSRTCAFRFQKMRLDIRVNRQETIIEALDDWEK
jgi:hypothetical protein